MYYWLDMDYLGGDAYNVPKFALICGELGLAGKIRETEYVVLWGKWKDVVGEEEFNWEEKMYAYLMEHLGFVPDYEIN